ncbi:MAG: class I SAM-dependent methyltransferase [Nanoarchaeota archaeon]|nr:class I SAM-dependent methyltransferase [Nanoarchaeota archaeon]
MNIEKKTKIMYDKFGEEYNLTRINKKPERLFNEFLEIPCMIKAVGKIKNKKLLDIGCGTGDHAKKYLKLGAKVAGVDISKTMINISKVNCPDAEFKIASMNKLPFKDNSFEIITASLVVDYIKDLKKAFREVNRVLKKGSLFFYSDQSIISGAREKVRIDNKLYNVVGYIKDDNKEKTCFGNCWKSYVRTVELVPGMKVNQHVRPMRNHLFAIKQAGFELVDLIDCKPTADFKKYDPKTYKIYTKFPLFNIFVCKKK